MHHDQIPPLQQRQQQQFSPQHSLVHPNSISQQQTQQHTSQNQQPRPYSASSSSCGGSAASEPHLASPIRLHSVPAVFAPTEHHQHQHHHHHHPQQQPPQQQQQQIPETNNVCNDTGTPGIFLNCAFNNDNNTFAENESSIQVAPEVGGYSNNPVPTKRRRLRGNEDSIEAPNYRSPGYASVIVDSQQYSPNVVQSMHTHVQPSRSTNVTPPQVNHQPAHQNSHQLTHHAEHPTNHEQSNHQLTHQVTNPDTNNQASTQGYHTFLLPPDFTQQTILASRCDPSMGIEKEQDGRNYEVAMFARCWMA